MSTVMTDEKTPTNAQPDNEPGAESSGNEKKQSPLKFYKDLVKQAQELAKAEDWQKAGKELDGLSHQWSDGPDAKDEDQEEKIKDLFYKFTKATETYDTRKKQEVKKQQEERKKKISQKKDLLKELKVTVKNEEWSKRSKVRKLQGQWNSISADINPELHEEFNSLIKEFKSHKVDQLVEKRQKQEDNLMLKMAVLDKMERITARMSDKTSDWNEVNENFDDLTRQWKKMGRVPREKADRVWQRYKDAQDAYYDSRYKYDKKHRKLVDKFATKKEKICRQAENLIEQDLLKASRKINGLHRRWKKAGNLPQRKEDALWDRFKAAVDAFNEKKANNQDKLEEREQANYEEKEKIISSANEIKETTDWNKGHQQMQTLMNRWKKGGPVTQRHSNELWKQFKKAMDYFYDRRREYFKESEERQKENLKEKEEILEQLRELGEHEDPIEAVNKSKPLQAKFKDIGYVPIKKKNEIWKKYRETCDVIYNRFRAAKSGDKFDEELAKSKIGHEQRAEIQQLRKKHKKIQKEAKQLKEEVLQYQESKSYFTSSDSDNPLLKEMQAKIDNAQEQLNNKEDKLAEIDKEMDMIKEER